MLVLKISGFQFLKPTGEETSLWSIYALSLLTNNILTVHACLLEFLFFGIKIIRQAIGYKFVELNFDSLLEINLSLGSNSHVVFTSFFK